MSVPGRVAPLPLRWRPARAFHRLLPTSGDLLLSATVTHRMVRSPKMAHSIGRLLVAGAMGVSWL